MAAERSSALLYICSRVKARYLAFEDIVLSQVWDSISARLLGGFSRNMSVLLSGCFIMRIANEDRYLLFAAESLLVQDLRALIYSFGRYLSRNYNQSLSASFFSILEAMVRDVNWESAKRGSWLLKKIYHA